MSPVILIMPGEFCPGHFPPLQESGKGGLEKPPFSQFSSVVRFYSTCCSNLISESVWLPDYIYIAIVTRFIQPYDPGSLKQSTVTNSGISFYYVEINLCCYLTLAKTFSIHSIIVISEAY